MFIVDQQSITMSQPPIEDIPTDQLLKRKRFTGIVLAFVWIAATLSIAMSIYIYIRDGDLATKVIIPGLACFVTSIPMYTGRKKITEEINKRGK